MIEELKEYFKEDFDEPKVAEILKGYTNLEGLTKDDAKNLFEKNDIFRAVKDSYVTNALNTFREGSYKREVENAVKEELEKRTKKTPEQLKDEEWEKRLRLLEEQNLQKDKELKRNVLYNDAVAKIKEKGLKEQEIYDFAKRLIVEDEKITTESINKLIELVELISVEAKKAVVGQTGAKIQTNNQEQITDKQKKYNDALKKGDYISALFNA